MAMSREEKNRTWHLNREPWKGPSLRNHLLRVGCFYQDSYTHKKRSFVSITSISPYLCLSLFLNHHSSLHFTLQLYSALFVPPPSAWWSIPRVNRTFLSPVLSPVALLPLVSVRCVNSKSRSLFCVCFKSGRKWSKFGILILCCSWLFLFSYWMLQRWFWTQWLLFVM